MNQVAVLMLPCFPTANSEDTVTKLSYFGALTYCDKEQQVEAKALILCPEPKSCIRWGPCMAPLHCAPYLSSGEGDVMTPSRPWQRATRLKCSLTPIGPGDEMHPTPLL